MNSNTALIATNDTAPLTKPTDVSSDLKAASEAAMHQPAIRQKAARNLDPRTAEVVAVWVLKLPPNLIEGVPEHFDGSGCSFIARAPNSEVWVSFDDLPASKYNVLERRLTESLPECWMCGAMMNCGQAPAVVTDHNADGAST